MIYPYETVLYTRRLNVIQHITETKNIPSISKYTQFYKIQETPPQRSHDQDISKLNNQL